MSAIAATKPAQNVKPTKPRKEKATPVVKQYLKIVQASEKVMRVVRDLTKIFEADKSEQWGEQVEEAFDAARAAGGAIETCRMTWAQMQTAGYQPPVVSSHGYQSGQQVWPRAGELKNLRDLYSPAELNDLEVVRSVGKKWLILKIRATGQTMHVAQGRYTGKEPK